MTAPVPNLVIAGVTKAGTTGLLHYLAQHPQVCGERHKESQPLLEHGTDPARLAAARDDQFRHWRGEPVLVESSPAYFPAGPGLLAPYATDDGRNPRVIIVLRDPVDRIWSGYRMKLAKQLVAPGSFDAFVEHGLAGPATDTPDADLFRVFDTSRYDVHLQPWLDALGDRVLVLFFDDLAADPAKVLRRTLRWLGLDDGPVAGFDLSVHNRGGLHRSAAVHGLARRVNRAGSDLLRRSPGLKGLMLRTYARVNGASVEERMSPATRTRLRAHYRGSSRRLARLLTEHGHQDLPSWLPAAPSTTSGTGRSPA